MATRLPTSSIEGSNLRGGLEIGALLLLRTALISKIIEVSVVAIFFATTDVDDVLVIGITTDEISIHIFPLMRDRSWGGLPWAVSLLLHQRIVAFSGVADQLQKLFAIALNLVWIDAWNLKHFAFI